MEKKYQVFISSTFDDLKEERQKARDTILSMYQFPIGMEMFSAADEEQWNVIKETIDSSDYYIVIIAQRYGSIIEHGVDKGISYTQKEFSYAKKKGVPILAFIINDSVLLTADKVETDEIKKEKLKEFKEKAKTGRVVEWWETGDELARKVAVALSKEIQKGKRPGWIRAESNVEKDSVPCADEKIMKLGMKKYPNLLAAYNDIVSDITDSTFFDFMGLQGANFLRDSNNLSLAIKEKSNLKIRYLVQYPFSDEIRRRLENLPECLNDDDLEEKWRTIYGNIKELKRECYVEYRKAESVELRYFSNPLVFRLLFTQKHLYMNYYEKGKNTTQCEVYRYDYDSPTYETYQMYFNNIWIKAQHSLPTKKITAKYSFLKDRYFQVTPSLVINVCADCDMNCSYCPKEKNGQKLGGENLKSISQINYCNMQAIKNLVKEFSKHILNDRDKPILRITGGEPLFGSENRKRTMAILSSAEDYNRIVLCTNGISFIKAYNENSRLWEGLKRKMLLKISLDTLNEEKFQILTGTKAGTLESVKNGIQFAAKKKFRIELNVVATKENVSDLEDILKLFEFSIQNHLVGIKILTVNDFGGNVSFEQTIEEQANISQKLEELIEKLRLKGYEEREVFLNDNKGIKMKRFVCHYVDPGNEQDEECTLTIVDHHNSSLSLTPRRTFSEFCIKCKYYPKNVKKDSGIKPCATGVMSLTLRADGLFSPCRLLTDSENAINISNMKPAVIRSSMDELLRKYDRCWYES